MIKYYIRKHFLEEAYTAAIAISAAYLPFSFPAAANSIGSFESDIEFIHEIGEKNSDFFILKFYLRCQLLLAMMLKKLEAKKILPEGTIPEKMLDASFFEMEIVDTFFIDSYNDDGVSGIELPGTYDMVYNMFKLAGWEMEEEDIEIFEGEADRGIKGILSNRFLEKYDTSIMDDFLQEYAQEYANVKLYTFHTKYPISLENLEEIFSDMEFSDCCTLICEREGYVFLLQPENAYVDDFVTYESGVYQFPMHCVLLALLYSPYCMTPHLLEEK